MDDHCSIRLPDFWEPADIAYADIYHADRGNDSWTGDDTVKQQALNRAWDYIRMLNFSQEAWLCHDTPDDVLQAHCVIASYELTTPNLLSPVETKDDYLIKKDIAGVIVKEWQSGAPSKPRIIAADRLLSPYLRGGGSSSNVPLIRG